MVKYVSYFLTENDPTMATGSVSENVPITQFPTAPSDTEFDGDEESFVVLGRSPSSFTFCEEGRAMLTEAMKTLHETATKEDVIEQNEITEELKSTAAQIENDVNVNNKVESESINVNTAGFVSTYLGNYLL